MKGIILAGGSGSRLYPLTKVVSKQLQNVFDKPMIYYPLSTLMLSGIREIIIITTANDLEKYKELLGDGSELGMKFAYKIQPKPEGIAQALVLAEDFLAGEKCCLILGDNLFYGPSLGNDLRKHSEVVGCQVFAYQVANPHQYGVLEIASNGNVLSLEEKPLQPKSNYAITGLYYFDSKAPLYARDLKKSVRGEFEIVDVLNSYFLKNQLKVNILQRGTAWLDTGTPATLHDAAGYIRAVQERQGLLISSPEEIAYRNDWISASNLFHLIQSYPESRYKQNLKLILKEGE
jgi:glucose-1-phosphate thymidylyltransferase